MVTNQAMDESFSLQHRWVFVATVFHAQIVSGLQWIHPIGPKAFRYFEIQLKTDTLGLRA